MNFMTLVDQQIRKLIEDEVLVQALPEKVGAVAYDLRCAGYIDSRRVEHNEYLLAPGESVFVRCKELLYMQPDLIARIHLRNSMIRMGLHLDAPVYYPGHQTAIYFRITNFTEKSIQLSSDFEIASIMFERLDQAPETPYNGTFQSELAFAGMGDYEKKYKPNIIDVEEKVESLKNVEKNMYSTVMTIMAVFLALFSLINVNIDLAYAEAVDATRLLVFNFLTIGSIGFLVSIIQICTHKSHFIRNIAILVLSLIILIIGTCIALG